MRYVQQENLKKKPEKKEPRELKKPGKYTSEELMGSRKIPTKDGYK